MGTRCDDGKTAARFISKGIFVVQTEIVNIIMNALKNGFCTEFCTDLSCYVSSFDFLLHNDVWACFSEW